MLKNPTVSQLKLFVIVKTFSPCLIFEVREHLMGGPLLRLQAVKSISVKRTSLLHRGYLIR
jgi:hypothetical protein